MSEDLLKKMAEMIAEAIRQSGQPKTEPGGDGVDHRLVGRLSDTSQSIDGHSLHGR